MVNGEVNGIKIDKKGLMRRAFTSLTYLPSKTWQATGGVNYNGPNLSLQGTSNSFVASSFSVNKIYSTINCLFLSLQIMHSASTEKR